MQWFGEGAPSSSLKRKTLLRLCMGLLIKLIAEAGGKTADSCRPLERRVSCVSFEPLKQALAVETVTLSATEWPLSP